MLLKDDSSIYDDMTDSDRELMEFADSRMMHYPDVVGNNDKFESEESSDWDKAYALAILMKERGYPAPEVENYALANHIMKTWKAAKENEEVKKEKVDNWNI